MRKISFVIPCYNSERTIKDVVDEIIRTIKNNGNDEYEIILVNDYSSDNVWNVIKELCKRDSHIKGISFAKNFGQHAALMAGYRAVTGDIVVSLDDDGQTPAEEVYSLIDKLDEGYDVVYASYEKKKHNLGRNMGTVANNFMCEVLLGKPKKLMLTSFFVARKFIVTEMVKYSNSFTYIPGLVLRTTKNIGSVCVNHRERMIGNSGYSIWKLLNLWMNGFTAFSVIPLRLSTFVGVIFAIIGFASLVWVIINKILSTDVLIGWSSTIAILLLLGGLILLMLGIIGEYLGRIYISLNNSPQYVIKYEENGKES